MSVSATIHRLSVHAKLVHGRVLAVQTSPTDQIKYFDDLAVAASRAGDSLLCTSILAGHSSESDEFCDVGVWLGEGNFGKGNETLVLDTLGLKQGTITSVSLAHPTNIPTTVRVTSTTTELDAFAQKLAALKELHCFSSRSPSSSDVIYSLIGKSAAGGWGGLVGIGTESDY